MNKRKICMLILIALIGGLAVYTFVNPGSADAESVVYASPLALLPSVVAIALALPSHAPAAPKAAVLRKSRLVVIVISVFVLIRLFRSLNEWSRTDSCPW